jgi:hypothetical protein
MGTVTVIESELTTIPKAAKLLPVPTPADTVRRWAVRGIGGRVLPSVVVGGKRYIRPVDLLKFVSYEGSSASD